MALRTASKIPTLAHAVSKTSAAKTSKASRIDPRVPPGAVVFISPGDCIHAVSGCEEWFDDIDRNSGLCAPMFLRCRAMSLTSQVVRPGIYSQPVVVAAGENLAHRVTPEAFKPVPCGLDRFPSPWIGQSDLVKSIGHTTEITRAQATTILLKSFFPPRACGNI